MDSKTQTSKFAEDILNEKDVFDVIIVGGGVAGLKCASKLYVNGIKNVLVLEAQDYLGGRIKTTTILSKDGKDEIPLEAGATWIHGHSNENPISRLVYKYPNYFVRNKHCGFNLDNKNSHFVDESGNVYDREKCDKFYDLYHQWNLDAKSLWRTNQTTNHASYTEYMRARCEEFAKNSDENDKILYRALLERLLKAETAESGCATMDLLSVNEYGSYAIPEGDDLQWPGGFSTLIEYLASKMPSSRIKLNHPVRRILVENFGSDEILRIVCFGGNVFKTKHVVLTVSLNYLKEHVKNLIDETLLNERKLESIDKVKMDTVDKIFLFYDDMSFYPQNTNSIHPLFFNELKNGAKSSNSIGKNWIYKTYSYDKFYDNVLIVWMTGEEADYVEKLNDEEVVHNLTDLLRKLLNNPNIPLPDKMIRTKWNENPYILGGYSYVGLDCIANKHINDLAEPLYSNNMPRIMFAGEGTHLHYYSTVHGAYLSGKREAERLLNLYNIQMRNKKTIKIKSNL